MQGHKFTTDVFLILLENYHLVLGVQWLATLDDSLWNFKSLSMKFLRGKELCELKVKNNKSVGISSTSKINKFLSKKEELASVQLCDISIRKRRRTMHSYYPHKWRIMLHSYQRLNTWCVHMKTCLRIQVNCRYRINLKEGQIWLACGPTDIQHLRKTPSKEWWVKWCKIE